MPIPGVRSRREIPAWALGVSLVTLGAPIAGIIALPPDFLKAYGALLLLPAVVPAFILGYYRGWKGTLTAVASALVALAVAFFIGNTVQVPLPSLSGGLVVALLGMILGIGWLTELLHRDRDAIESLAFTDLLTRLPNRRHARLFLENEFAAAQRGRTLSCVLFDLDHFKNYNDRFGHQAGDECLEAFARILAENTRRMNLSARLGGEEFLTILAETDSEGAVAFAERVRSGLRSVQLRKGSITVSAGVATFHASMKSPDEVLAAADHALYRAKREGRDCVRVFGRAASTMVLPDGSGPTVSEDLGASPAYGRPPSEIGRTSPPARMLPNQVTEFGFGRRVLVVEDDHSVRDLIRRYLEREAFEVVDAEDVRSAQARMSQEFDIVVTDLRLPGAPGTELIAAVKSRWPDTEVIAITGMNDPEVAAEALTAGADRYLFKPFDMRDLRTEMVDALGRRDATLSARRTIGRATPAEARRDALAREALVEGARALVRAVEVRDVYLSGHGSRVAAYAAELARALDPGAHRLDLESLSLGAELHDVGKIGIPDAVLNKQGPLTDEEKREVRTHPALGRTILSPLLGNDTILSVVSWHHERWDGTGYPDGLMGETIPLPARIVAVADILDALTSPRAYRPAVEFDVAADRIVAAFGTRFDPGLRSPFREALPELRRMWESHAAAHEAASRS